MIEAFEFGKVEAHFIAPDGVVADHWEVKGYPIIKTSWVSYFHHTTIGYYKGMRWLILFREAILSIYSIIAIIQAKNKWPDIKLIHLNEYNMIPALIASKLIFRCPVIVHVRSPLITKHGKLRSAICNYIANKYADLLVTIDGDVSKTLPDSSKKIIIHNSYSITSDIEDSTRNILTQINKEYITIALVSNLLDYKGIYDFLDAAYICLKRNLKIHFVYAGDDVHDFGLIKRIALFVVGRSYNNRLKLNEKAIQLGIDKNITFTGYIKDVHNIYKSIDVLCFPSHIGGIGRPVFEAAFYKVPSIVAINEPAGDTIIDGVTGICVEPKNIEELADAMEYLYLNKSARVEMGEEAYKFALENFDTRKNAAKMLDVYKSITTMN